MRLNKYIALATGMGRRAADTVIQQNRVTINGVLPTIGQQVEAGNVVTLDGHPITPAVNSITIMLNKPIGYVCSRDGQGSQTIYDLLPPEYHSLKSIGRLDKDSSGLLLLTNDGQLAYELTHPSRQKIKLYEIELDKALQALHQQMITDYGISLEDGVSKLQLERLRSNDKEWAVTMREGRNRQIRRTFESLGYAVRRLHRIQFGNYQLGNLIIGHFKTVETS